MINTERFQVNFNHKISDRHPDDVGRKGADVLGRHGTPVNGSTACVITVEDSNNEPIQYYGFSFCSKEDNFSRKEGRKKSFNRAIKKIHDRDLRMDITKAFNKREGYPFREFRGRTVRHTRKNTWRTDFTISENE